MVTRKLRENSAENSLRAPEATQRASRVVEGPQEAPRGFFENPGANGGPTVLQRWPKVVPKTVRKGCKRPLMLKSKDTIDVSMFVCPNPSFLS